MAMAVIFYEELLTSCIKLKGLIYGMRFFTVLRKCYSASKEFKIELCLIAEYISTVNLQASDRVSANDGIVVILGACILMDLGLRKVLFRCFVASPVKKIDRKYFFFIRHSIT